MGGEGEKVRERIAIASDGLRARLNGSYAKEKIEWQSRYLAGGLVAAQRKLTRVYVDLYAGCGLNIDKHSREQFSSGAVEAVQLLGTSGQRAPFTDAYLVNLDDDDHHALTERIDRLNAQGKLRVPRHKIRTIHGDANVVVHDIVKEIHPAAWIYTYADIENMAQMPFTTVQALKSRKHESVDLYALFPLQVNIQRILRFNTGEVEEFSPMVDRYFGTSEWRAIYEDRATPARAELFRKRLEALYCRQLETLWRKAGQVARIHFGSGSRVLYHMLFAASDPTALRIAEGVTRRRQNDELFEQPSLFR